MVNNPHAKIVAFKLILSTESKSVEHRSHQSGKNKGSLKMSSIAHSVAHSEIKIFTD